MRTGDAVVPSLRASTGVSPILQFPQPPASLLGFEGKDFLTASTSQLQFPQGLYGMNAPGLVPQLPPQLLPPGSVLAPGPVLTKAQQSELEMARRRAQKAAAGKRANAIAARGAKRKAAAQRAQEQEDDASSEDLYKAQEEEIEKRIAGAKDEKEAKRLKRLLRNRVSAQQARERKKSYVTDLEAKSREQESALAALQSRVQTLERENNMLRQVIKNMQASS